MSWNLSDIPPHIRELNQDLLGESSEKPQQAVSTSFNWEDRLLDSILTFSLPMPEREFSFHPDRRWRFDFAYPDKKIAVEVEGGIWTGGRHTRGGGFENDCEKYAEALCLGWKVLRVTPGQIDNNQVVDWLMRLLNG